LKPAYAFGALALTLAALSMFAAAASAASPDLKVAVSVQAANGTGPPTATADARAVATVTNIGDQAASAFEVDLTATDSKGAVVLRPHSLNVSALAAGANITLPDTTAFTVALSGDVKVFVTADPAGRINDTSRADNAVNVTVYFAPPPIVALVENVPARASETRTLGAYAYLAFRIDLHDGDSLIFQADSAGGVLFDCYLFDEANFARYADAREHPSTVGNVSFIRDYSGTSREHIAFTAEPLPPGKYYLVIDNDERLRSGAMPQGPVTVHYALAVVNNSLPAWAVVVVIAAAAAAIWATVRWRPHFDVRSPLLEIPPPDPDDQDGADPDEPDHLPADETEHPAPRDPPA
jgi:hypothetical protein